MSSTYAATLDRVNQLMVRVKQKKLHDVRAEGIDDCDDRFAAVIEAGFLEDVLDGRDGNGIGKGEQEYTDLRLKTDEVEVLVRYAGSLMDTIAMNYCIWFEREREQVSARFLQKNEGTLNRRGKLVRTSQTSNTVNDIVSLGKRPEVGEICEFLEKYPETWCKFPATLLKVLSRARGFNHLMHFAKVGSRYYLFIYWWSLDFHADYRFIVFS
ncbi:MAG: hypothetical protein Q7S19_02265 [bacterium]|nr:hypothetical protein [bacterium]